MTSGTVSGRANTAAPMVNNFAVIWRYEESCIVAETVGTKRECLLQDARYFKNFAPTSAFYELTRLRKQVTKSLLYGFNDRQTRWYER